MAFFFMDGSVNLLEKSNLIDYYSNLLSFDEIKSLIHDFEVHGEKVFNQLKVDFAIVFTLNGSFYLLRDSFGNTPLYYTVHDNKIYYSIKLINLVNQPFYKKQINPIELNYYFKSSNTNYGYNDQTIWKGIYSVLPGQVLSIDYHLKKNNVNFFKLSTGNQAKNNVFESFREVFKKSILKNIHQSNNVSSSLSGGIDSSSITSMLQKLSKDKINTIELRTPFEIGKERNYAQEVVDMWSTNHTILSNYPNFYDSEVLSCEITGSPSYSLLTAGRMLGIINIMKELKSDTYYMGEGGDQVLGLQREYLDELIEKANFQELKVALLKALGIKGISNIELHNVPYASYFLKSTLKDLIIEKKIFKIILFLRHFYNITILSNYIKKYLNKKHLIEVDNSIVLEDLLNQDIRGVNDNSKNHLELLKPDNLINFNYIKNIFSWESIKLKEQNFLIGQNYGIKFIYPFYDKGVLDFISSADKKLNFGDGLGRNIIRQSMKGIMPDSIVRRNSKTFFSPFLHQVFWDLNSNSDSNFPKNHLIWNYIDYTSFKKIERLVKNSNYFDFSLSGEFNSYLITSLKVYYFGIWLDVHFK